MKTLAFACLILFSSYSLPCDCFDFLLEKGKDALKKRQFSTALQKLTAARDCPEKPAGADLEDWIRRAQQGLDERTAWSRATNADTRESYQRYLDRYPQGYYRRRAEDALKRFEILAEKPVQETSTAGAVNWTLEYVEAQGQSIINREKWPNDAQALLMAQRGAEVIAKANLLEIIDGVHITRTTTVKDMATESDLVQSRKEGIIKGARLFGPPLVANGMVTVTMRVPLFGAGGVATAAMSSPVLPPDTSDFDDTAALVLALRVPPAGVQRSLFPSFTDAQGNLLLDGAAFGRQYALPLVRYCQLADFPSAYRVVNAGWDAQGRLVLPAAVVPVFQNWLKIRESGGGAPPVFVGEE